MPSLSAPIGEAEILRLATGGRDGNSLSLLSTLRRPRELSYEGRPLYFSSLGGVGGGPPPQLGLPSRSSKAPSGFGGVGGGTSPTCSDVMFALPMIGCKCGCALRWRRESSRLGTGADSDGVLLTWLECSAASPMTGKTAPSPESCRPMAPRERSGTPDSS
jgi:hypothetical protein